MRLAATVPARARAIAPRGQHAGGPQSRGAGARRPLPPSAVPGAPPRPGPRIRPATRETRDVPTDGTSCLGHARSGAKERLTMTTSYVPRPPTIAAGAAPTPAAA